MNEQQKAADEAKSVVHGVVSNDTINTMIDRFLGWRLPENFRPDAGITFTRPDCHEWPTGTNLFDADQARHMIRYMLGLDS